MATAYVTIGPVWTRDVFLGIGNRSETIATSAASARGNLVAEAGQFAQIVCHHGTNGHHVQWHLLRPRRANLHRIAGW